MPVIWSNKTVLFVPLRGEVTKDNHSGGVRAQKYRSHKQFKVFECLVFTVGGYQYLVQESGGENDVRFIIRIELDDHEISIVWEMVSTAEGKIF